MNHLEMQKYKEFLYNPNISYDEMTRIFRVPIHLYKYQSFYNWNGRENTYWKENMRGAFHLSLGKEFEDENDCRIIASASEVRKEMLEVMKKITNNVLSINEMVNVLDEQITSTYVNGINTNFQSEIRIGCFTISSENEKMWRKYANGETGFCIEYSTRNNKLFECATLPVCYLNGKYNYSSVLAYGLILRAIDEEGEQFHYYDKIYEKQLKCAYIPIFIKQKDKWSFEEEYRMFLLNNRNTRCGILRKKDYLDENFNINLSKEITSIYLGEKFELNRNYNALYEEILKIAEDKNVNVYQKKKIEGEYTDCLVFQGRG